MKKLTIESRGVSYGHHSSRMGVCFLSCEYINREKKNNNLQDKSKRRQTSVRCLFVVAIGENGRSCLFLWRFDCCCTKRWRRKDSNKYRRTVGEDRMAGTQKAWGISGEGGKEAGTWEVGWCCTVGTSHNLPSDTSRVRGLWAPARREGLPMSLTIPHDPRQLLWERNSNFESQTRGQKKWQ